MNRTFHCRPPKQLGINILLKPRKQSPIILQSLVTAIACTMPPTSSTIPSRFSRQANRRPSSTTASVGKSATSGSTVESAKFWHGRCFLDSTSNPASRTLPERWLGSSSVKVETPNTTARPPLMRRPHNCGSLWLNNQWFHSP